MEAALPLESVDFDHSVELSGDVSSMSAEQYLSWVRYQAGNLPNVKRVEAPTSIANRQSKYMPEIRDIPECPVDCLPSEEWQRELLYSFSELRQTLERLALDEASKERKVAVPQMKDRDAWHRFCFAAEVDPLSSQPQSSEQPFDVAQVSVGEELSFELSEKGISAGAVEQVSFHSDLVPALVSTDVPSSVSESDRAMVKRKRDLAYQLGITLVKKTDDTAFEVTRPVSISAPADDPAGSDDDQDSNGEGLEYVEDEEMTAAIEGAWAEAAIAMQWSGAINVEPTTTVLLQFDQVLTQRLLALHIDWMEERSLTPPRGRWLYALLARTEKPLHRDTASSIRQLYRRCCALRYQLSLTSGAVPLSSSAPLTSAEDDANTAVKFQNELASLNVLISICGSYFGQGEEYDAFNRALMIEAAQIEEQENEEDEEYGYDDEGYEDGEETYEGTDMEYVEEISQRNSAVNSGAGLGEWQSVSVTRAVPSQQFAETMELEEGEEVETEAVECPSGKKSRV